MTYSLYRESDGAGDSGPWCRIARINPDTQKVEIDQLTRPKVGWNVTVGAIGGRTYDMQDYWMTTPITEILEEDENMVKFRTRSNSIYVWKIF